MELKIKLLIVLILQFMVTSVILGTMLQVIRRFIQNRRDAISDKWKKDKDVLDFLEHADKQGPWSEDDDKPFTIGGLTADKDQDFKKFINKIKDEEKEKTE